MRAHAVLIALMILLPGTTLAQSAYDRHVAFDNSLTDKSHYYSNGFHTAPSELELVNGKIPVEERNFFSPPNCLRLKWRSQNGGDWQASLNLQTHYRRVNFSGSMLSFRCYSDGDLPAAESPLVYLIDVNGEGIYGFRDGFNLTENWFEDVNMGLNQAPIVVMIENYRSGLIWSLFMSNPEIEPALKAIGFLK